MNIKLIILMAYLLSSSLMAVGPHQLIEASQRRRTTPDALVPIQRRLTRWERTTQWIHANRNRLFIAPLAIGTAAASIILMRGGSWEDAQTIFIIGLQPALFTAVNKIPIPPGDPGIL